MEIGKWRGPLYKVPYKQESEVDLKGRPAGLVRRLHLRAGGYLIWEILVVEVGISLRKGPLVVGEHLNADGLGNKLKCNK